MEHDSARKFSELNIELASVGRFETWPHADSETSPKIAVIEAY
jgi:hypothetical protein